MLVLQGFFHDDRQAGRLRGLSLHAVKQIAIEYTRDVSIRFAYFMHNFDVFIRVLLA